MEGTTSINSWAQNVDPMLSVTILPKDTTIFFNNWPHTHALPTPYQIRTSDYHTPAVLLNQRCGSQRILHFPELGLVVKHGNRTTIAEGQMLWAISKYCPEVRAPTVYGWCMDEGEIFMYISYIDGVTLDSRLETLGEHDLNDIARQLALMLSSLRRVTQPDEEAFIGSPDQGPCHDQIWWSGVNKGAFSSVKEYNDALFQFAKDLPQFPEHEIFQNVRASLPDTASILLTHTDLSPLNIIISPTGTEIRVLLTGRKVGGILIIGNTSNYDGLRPKAGRNTWI